MEVAYFNPGDVQAGDGVTLDQAWGHVRWVPETGHVSFATSSGGFWVVELEPEVREQLDLDREGPKPKPRHPQGRPGRRDIALAATAPVIDITPWYCTLGPLG